MNLCYNARTRMSCAYYNRGVLCKRLKKCCQENRKEVKNTINEMFEHKTDCEIIGWGIVKLLDGDFHEK